MSFSERLTNFLTLLDWTVYPRVASLDDNLVAKYAPEKQFVTLNYLAGRSQLWLYNTDVVIDYPRPMMANEVNIGGISTKPAQPLTGDLKAFVESAKEGVIVVTFGTLDMLPQYVYDKFMEAFKRLKQHVIWRYKFDFPPNVPKHIRLMDWIPQNDIMAHPNTKIFITHGGGNSQFEALYHGVPVISFPVVTDQPYNAKRAQYHGFGIILDLQEFTPDDLVHAVREIAVTDESYTENIQKMSKIFHSNPMRPKERAIFWIEHVMQHGGAHLHSIALDLPWYQYLMLDIFAFLFCVIAVIVFLVCKVCAFVCQKYRDGSIKKKAKLH